VTSCEPHKNRREDDNRRVRVDVADAGHGSYDRNARRCGARDDCDHNHWDRRRSKPRCASYDQDGVFDDSSRNAGS
jgi:hypothetical protein